MLFLLDLCPEEEFGKTQLSSKKLRLNNKMAFTGMEPVAQLLQIV